MYAGTLSYFAQLQAQYELSTLASKANISPMFQRDPTNPTQAVSTVKALQLANQQGQQIYKIDNTNIDTVLPKLNLSNSIKQDIQSSVNVGKYVITHTDNVSVPGWSGAGYAIIDPTTGSDAYMISGGENGGFYVGVYWGVAVGGALLLSNYMLVKNKVTGKLVVQLVGPIIGFLLTVRVIYEMYGLYPSIYGQEVQKCFAMGFLYTLSVMGLFANGIADKVFEAIELIVGFSTPTNTVEQCIP